jgi:hypothetical protein
VDLMMLALDKARASTLSTVPAPTGEPTRSAPGEVRPPAQGFGEPRPLIQTPYTERNGEISPDGRWLAYQSDNSGQFEIYVRPFPNVDTGLWQVSTGGGTRPLWARNGQELFYASPSGALMRVGVERGRSWAATTPTLVIKDGYVTVPGGSPGRTYDVSPDGQRFLLIKERDADRQTSTAREIVVVQHWFEELKRLVPTQVARLIFRALDRSASPACHCHPYRGVAWLALAVGSVPWHSTGTAMALALDQPRFSSALLGTSRCLNKHLFDGPRAGDQQRPSIRGESASWFGRVCWTSTATGHRVVPIPQPA